MTYQKRYWWFPRERTSEKRVPERRALTQIWVVRVISMEFSALVSQTSFRGKPPVAFRNVASFLRLAISKNLTRT